MNHQQLLHPHVVQLKEVMQVLPYLGLVMEYVPGGDMFGYVVNKRGLAEDEARWFFQQLILGMDYCHRKGVTNRDIKLENTLLVLAPDKKPLLKMCDFGYSKSELLDSIAKSKVGTPGYTAPEVITNVKGYDGKQADVWSAGVMLYTMLFARYPFERPDDKKIKGDARIQKVLHRIIKVDYEWPSNSSTISPELKDMMTKILVADPKERLTIQQIQQHPWFQKNLPAGSLEYNDYAISLGGSPPQSSREVDEIIDTVYKSSRKDAARRAGFDEEDDEYMDSQGMP